MNEYVTITLKRSLIRKTKKQKATIKGLGLKKLNQTVTRPNTREIQGMISKVGFMVEVS